MAKYELTSPEGQKFEITAPDDATEAQVMEYFQQSQESSGGSANGAITPDMPAVGEFQGDPDEVQREIDGIPDPTMKGLAQKAFDQQYGGSSGAPGKDYSETVAQYHAGTLGDRQKAIVDELAKRGEIELGLKPEDSFLQNVAGDLTKRTENVQKMVERRAPSGDVGPVKAAGEIAFNLPGTAALAIGQGAGAALDIAGEAVKSGYETLVPEGVQEGISSAAKKVLSTDIGQYGLKAIQKGGEIWGHFKESYPDAAMALEGIGNIASLGVGGSASKAAGKEAAYTVDDFAKAISKPFSAPTEQKISKIVEQGYKKGVRPTVAGKGSFAMASKASGKAEDAVKTIVGLKNDLALTTETGEKITGVLPQNLNQFSEAIGQAKNKIYQTYSQMAKDAGGKGAAFDTKPIIRKLSVASADLKNNPQVRKYAEDLIDDVIELRGQPPEVIEARIADLNRSLSGFYDGRVGQAKAQVDASVARLMRDELDNNITQAMGEGYQGLKKQYGALASIEKEVQQRATVFGRQNEKGLADFSDIFTGAEIVSGAASMLAGNPAGAKGVIAGLAGKAIKGRIKSANNADNIVKKMFREVDDLITKESSGPRSMAGKKFVEIKKQIQDSIRKQDIPDIENIIKQTKVNLGVPTYFRKKIKPDMTELPYSSGAAEASADAFEEIIQIARTPKGKRLLVERLREEEKYSQLLDAILDVPSQKALPGGQGFELLAETESKARLAGQKTSKSLGAKSLPSGISGDISRAEKLKISARRRGLTKENR